MLYVLSDSKTRSVLPLRVFQGLALISLLMTGCRQGVDRGHNGSAVGGPPKVLATVGMVADVVREIGGDRVEVAQLMGPGVDPHLYKATRDDVQQIMSADAIFTSGLMLEGRLEEIHLPPDREGRRGAHVFLGPTVRSDVWFDEAPVYQILRVPPAP